MEARDQISQDLRPFRAYNEVEQGALLADLASTLWRRLAYQGIDQSDVPAYRNLATSAKSLGEALVAKNGVPFVPAPPFHWSAHPQPSLERRVGEIRDWAASVVVDKEQPQAVRQSALDLAEAGRELERHQERTRSR